MEDIDDFFSGLIMVSRIMLIVVIFLASPYIVIDLLNKKIVRSLVIFGSFFVTFFLLTLIENQVIKLI